MKKSPKAPKTSAPTTTDLRAEDPRVLRAEIDVFRQKIVERALADPRKAAVIVTEWAASEGTPARRKKAA